MKTNPNISDLLFPNKYRCRVLALLLTNRGKWIHQRELARLVGAVAGTLKKEVDALVAVGLLRTQRVGREINPKVMTRDEWQHKKQSGSSFIQDILSKPKLMLLGAENEL